MKLLKLYFAVLLFAGCSTSPGATSEGVIDNPRVGLWQDRTESPVRFELEQVFGAEDGPEEELMNLAYNVFVDGEDNVYILDNHDNRVLSFTADAELRWSAGSSGNGPGAFKSPWGLMWDGERTIVVLDGEEIEVLDVDGRFVRTVNIATVGLPFTQPVGFIAPNQLVLKTGIPNRFGAQILTIDPLADFEISSRFELDQSRGAELKMGMSRVPEATILDGDIMVYDIGAYALSIHEPEGDTLLTMHRDVPEFRRPSFITMDTGNPDYPSWGIRPNADLTPPLLVEGGFYLIRAQWQTNVEILDPMPGNPSPPPSEYHRSLDLFDEHWRLLYSIENEHMEALPFQMPRAADSDGRLYATMASGTQLGRFRVIVDD